MSGLRERKKQERRDAILSAARELFCTHGFEAVTIEQIAAHAELSAGTVYNAFETKASVLTQVFLSDVANQMDKALLIPDGETGSKDAIKQLLEVYFAWMASYPKNMTRSFVGQSMVEPAVIGQHYTLIDELLRSSIHATFSRLEALGRIQSDVDAATCAKIVFNIANSEFYAWLMEDDIRTDGVVSSIMSQIDLILRSLVHPPGDARVQD